MLTVILLLLAAAQDLDTLQQDTTLLNKPNFKEKYNSHKKNHDPWFSQDKFMHFSLSAAIPGFTYYFYACQMNKNKNEGKIISISLTALIGIGKEIYDSKTKGHFAWKDIAWDGLGLAVGYFAFVK